MATDALGNTITTNKTYMVGGLAVHIDGDSITLALGNSNEGKVRQKASHLFNLADLLASISGGGGSWKQSVRVATTANGTLSTAFENGDTIDGVTLATGDRILIKNQSTASQNGIYTVNASGSPTRATDADTGAEIRGAVVFVEQGNVNADTMWVLSTNAPITIDSTSLSFIGVGRAVVNVNGATLDDSSVDITKLNGAGGVATGAMLYCDGTAWIALDPPGASATLKHDGTAPFWELD